jgi:hypothetical protein
MGDASTQELEEICRCGFQGTVVDAFPQTCRRTDIASHPYPGTDVSLVDELAVCAD